jgi:2-keto-3-deoxy-L-rhamnonate aldolase RhmA
MITVRNHAKERLEAGELALGVGLRQARTVDIGRIMKTAGYDFLFIDMEHNCRSTSQRRSASPRGTPASRRCPARLSALPRDPGARCRRAGIVVPHVDTPEVAPAWSQLQVSAGRPSLVTGACRSWTSSRCRRATRRSTRRRPDPDARDAGD